MNVAGALTYGLFDDGANELNDGSIIQFSLSRLRLLRDLLELYLAFAGILLRGRHSLIRTEIAVQDGIDLAHCGNTRLNDAVGDDGDVILRHHIHRVGHGQNEDIVLKGDGKHIVLAQHRAADQSNHLGCDAHAPQVDARNAKLKLQNIDDVAFVHHIQVHQALTQTLVGLGLQRKAGFQLLLGDEAFGDKQIAKTNSFGLKNHDFAHPYLCTRHV